MKLTSQVKLKTSIVDKNILHKTMQEFNDACNVISDFAFEFRTFNKFGLQKMIYYLIRDCFDLSAQLVVRAISVVADSYKLDTKTKRTFKKASAVVYDTRILSWKDDSVSIWTIEGRKTFSFSCGEYQKEQLKFEELGNKLPRFSRVKEEIDYTDLLDSALKCRECANQSLQKGESDFVYQDGEFYLYTTCEIPEEEEKEVEQYLGIDLGQVNIAVDSLETIYSGGHLNNLRKRNLRLRKKLQSKGTKSAKRLLKKRSKKEQRFAKDTNHCISKEIVETAQRHCVGISLEDLYDIRNTATVRKGQRYRLHSWAFYDLQQKIFYKAKKAGVKVKLIDPAYTSQECSCCGHTEKANRKAQSKFSCRSCGYTVHADYNAACVISSRAVVMRPNVSSATSLH